MEFFTKTKTIKLHSHFGKYLIADNDCETVIQSRNGSTRRAKWTVEPVEDVTNNIHRVRLKSCHGKYLTATATETPFLLGMTGNLVVQTNFDSGSEYKFDWEPVRDGFQVKLRSWCGKYLRANRATPPWRNSVTHDGPLNSATQNWFLWDVQSVELEDENESLFSESVVSPSACSDYLFNLVPVSSMPIIPHHLSRNFKIQCSNKFKTAMDFFHHAKAVRFRSNHHKYLLAEEDEESVSQHRKCSSKNAEWIIEHVPQYDNVIRLKSCYGKYLTASNHPFLFGMAGRKVLQTLPHRLDSSVEWEPVKYGSLVKLRTRYGNFLRANNGLPPWRNSVTHDIPNRSATQDWILWDVDVVETNAHSSVPSLFSYPSLVKEDSSRFDNSVPSSPVVPTKSPSHLSQQSNDSKAGSSHKLEGRTIYYHVAEDNEEESDEDMPENSLIFNGNGVEELTSILEEETGVEGIIVCSRSPLNRKLYPLRLQLPPNNVTMQVVLVHPLSKVARDFEAEGLL
ncbi:PREDICTED: uncharacterized protein LOC109331890 [Lupinus angustifolius]|uniref:uncharacterized protein LOC109331890 n=1 Tax=Lupinus angustifolius TaxID=3871 RepID=UPI00092F4C3F|nr:PREDICTED: uncharacterized protein LOC109331890 [Lupinus angustifolius]